ncbi:hypothetical protein WM40_17285 [Robbsia andropogonis]|uniref:Winged helix-turn-helix domain-containing protein n=1 Tax=Robbsia andropogonis TaxID=28092 RepID=A0A0F5JXM4_9BURK|nr:helix-turn-helix domain-containing protein [Robbsia andropogonis]KKB62460.1 hypothetical protein WM40_17285 [Robbsia andropogonis]
MNRDAQLAAIMKAIPGNESVAQRARLVTALQKLGPITTLEARRHLDVLMPAARIHELRHGQGMNILTHRLLRETEAGNLHSVGVYALHPGKWRGA